MYPGSAVALLGGTVYGLLPAISTPEDLERRATQVAAAFVGAHQPFEPLVGIGRISAAAASPHVHDNTFRYRLRRLKEIGLFDLDDPHARFAAMLQLRLLDDQ